MGSDSYNNLSNWKNHEALVNNYDITVYSREGFEPEKKNDRIHLLTAPVLNISSTYIRNQIKTGKSIKYLVPDTVYNELTHSNYYK